MAKPKLTYFSVRGLIEPIRLLLKDAKVEYEMIELGPFVRGAYNEGLDALRQLKVCLLILILIFYYFIYFF